MFLVVLMIVNSMIFSDENRGVVPLSINFVVLTGLLFSQTKNINLMAARNIFLWSNIFTTGILMWITGSLHYGIILPVFILIASLMLQFKVFLLFSAYCICTLATFGFMKTNGQLPTVPDFGYWQLIDSIIMISSAIYTAWQTSFDMKYALKNLSREIENVTDSREKIKELVKFDALTGLANHGHCEESYKHLVEDYGSNDTQVALYFLDIDNFKTVNDFYDHSTGDKLLFLIAQRLKKLISCNDIACRLGGDEFVLVVSKHKNFNFDLFAKKILKCLSEPIKIDSNIIDITVSIGVAVVTSDDLRFNEIRKKADLAMYKSKQTGKNNYTVYNEEMYKQSQHKLTIVNGLKKALENGDLEVFLQPKVDITTGKVNSAEALIRWTSNNDGNIGPAEFIPLIESSELICDIGEWVLNHACRLCKEWHDNGCESMTISVNISSSQFMRGGVKDIIERELRASQLLPQYLEIELTEHAVFHDDNRVLEELKQIKELGVILSIDDFGTGYSNIEYLTKFNVDLVKIDRSFISGIHNSKQKFVIVTAIVEMAKTLGLRVVAEGIETKQEWEVLKELQCDYGQGFLWSEALSPINFTRYLSQNLCTK